MTNFKKFRSLSCSACRNRFSFLERTTFPIYLSETKLVDVLDRKGFSLDARKLLLSLRKTISRRCVFLFFADSTYYYCNGDTLASSHTNSQQGGGCNNTGPENSTDVASRSPLAATRASSGASAASPTGSACTKPDHTSTPTDLYLA